MKVYPLITVPKIPLAYLPTATGERTFEIFEDIAILLPEGRLIIIPKGFQTDLSSIPSWLWSIIKPMDKALIADIIHDYLWVTQAEEIIRFNGSSYEARKYADDLRLKTRNILAPKKKIKNYLTHYVIRLIGGFFYSRQIKIPN